jgi:predicted Zn-dependent protease
MIEDQEITTLRILGHMYWQLGYLPKAERLFKALLSLLPGDRETRAQLAAIFLEGERWPEALNHVEDLLGEQVPATEDGFLWLLKAKALWQLERQAEARAALDEYLATREVGGKQK